MLRNLLVFLLILYFLFLIHQDWLRLTSLGQENLRTASSLAQEQKLNKNLRTKISLLKTDDYIEDLARERLGLIKPGEMAIKIIK